LVKIRLQIKGNKVKANKLGLPIILSSALLIGCQSSTDQLIKNESRCEGYQAPEGSTFPDLIIRVSPNWPYKAIKNNTSGYVVVEFDISEQGKPINISVVESYPGDLFSKNIISAIKQWQYEARAAQCIAVTIEFNLSDTSS
jgi:TonB family protein